MTSKANCLLFSLEELQAYKKISRDANPIHDTGLVFGILIMARVEAILSAHWDYQAITKYEHKFLKPLFVGERIDNWRDKRHWLCLVKGIPKFGRPGRHHLEDCGEH